MPSGNSEESDAGGSDDLTSAEAAEVAAAEAEARAQAARARATALRAKLESAGAETSTPADDDLAPAEAPAETPRVTSKRRRRIRLPRPQIVAATVAVLLTAALLGGAGYMLRQHQKAVADHHREAEFAAAARQGVVNLMSMDSNAAKETVQRVIDDSTGKFQANFKDSADDLIKAMQEAKVVTKVTVNDVAVKEMTDESAVVLVAATSERQDAQAPKEDKQPRVWRVIITVVRDGGQIKMSDVEFA